MEKSKTPRRNWHQYGHWMFMVEALKHFQKKYGRHKQAADLAMLGTLGIDPNKKDYIF
jgi:hypothetical protein